jgi:hypothetical protein
MILELGTKAQANRPPQFPMTITEV